MLSRFPITVEDEAGDLSESCVFNIQQIKSVPLSQQRLRKMTQRDPVLRKVLRYTQHGWPDDVTTEMRPCVHRKSELTVQYGILMWGIRVVVTTCNKPKQQAATT